MDNYLLYGGGKYDLSRKDRQIYKQFIRRLLIKPVSNLTPDENIGFHTSFKHALSILYSVVKKVIIGTYIDRHISLEQKTHFFKLLFRITGKTYEKSHSIEELTRDPRNYSFEYFNIKSLQCVILLTLIDLEIKKIKSDSDGLMQTYPSGFELPKLFRAIISNDWTNYEVIKSICLSEDYLRNIVLKFIPQNVFDIMDGKPQETVSYTTNIEKLHIPVFLGELTLEEILESEFMFVHFIGITTESEFADGRHFTPFEYFHHDLVHAQNIDKRITNVWMKIMNAFYKFLKDKHKQTNILQYNSYIVLLFLLIHESTSPDILRSESIENLTIDKIPNVNFIRNINNWTNPNFFGGLLPPAIQGKAQEIMPYLNSNLLKLHREYKDWEEATGIMLKIKSETLQKKPTKSRSSIVLDAPKTNRAAILRFIDNRTKITASESPSPSHRSSFHGPRVKSVFVQKYLKYKRKYIQLKNLLNNKN